MLFSSPVTTIARRCALAALLVQGAALAQPAQSDESTAPAESAAPAEQGVATIAVPAKEEAAKLPAKADEQDQVRLDDVVVTATKRAKSLRDISGSVGAVSGKALEEMGARDMEDFIKLIPGVALNKNDGGRGSPSIRGINVSQGLGNTQAPTGFYVDDIPFNDPFFPGGTIDFTPYDLQRVEVLKGPQGTLYGSVALAGAIRYITETPELGVSSAKFTLAQTQVSGGGREPFGAMALNAPIGDDAAVRVVGVKYWQPGYIDETLRKQEDVNRSKSSQQRISALWNLNGRLSVAAKYFEQDMDSDDASFSNRPDKLERNDTPTASPSELSFDALNLELAYRFDWATLLSSSNLIHKHNLVDPDITRTVERYGGGFVFNVPVTQALLQSIALHQSTDITARGVTQELRLTSPDDGGPWEWLAGLWYLDWQQFVDQKIPTPILSQQSGLLLLLPGALRLLDPAVLSDTVDSVGSEKAVFGEVTRHLGEKWQLTLGGRYFQTQIDATVATSGLSNPVLFSGLRTENTFNIVSRGFNPKASLRYEANHNLAFYALASKGFQFGGVQLAPNSPLNTGAPIEPTYKSSTLWNYEIGTRTQWLDRRLNFDLTAFLLKWTDLQISGPSPNGITVETSNVGAAHSQGIEAALSVLPLQGLTLSSSASWMRAVTDAEFSNTDGTVPAGAPLPGAARFQLANMAAYEMLLSSWSAGVSLTHSLVGPSYNSLFKTQVIGDYQTFDAGVHLNGPMDWGRPELRFTVNNLTDVRALATAAVSSSGRAGNYIFIKPRTVELRLTLQFQ